MDDSTDKMVDPFGIGTYDFPQVGRNKGEDSNSKHIKNALPGTPIADKSSAESYESYPGSTSPFSLASKEIEAVAMLPADYDCPPVNKKNPPSHYDSVVHTTAESALPGGPDSIDGPVARSSWYDKSVVTANGMFADHTGDTFAAKKKESLPSVPQNVVVTDRLKTVSNPYTGGMYQDQTDYLNVPTEGVTVKSASIRVSTNIELVRSLAGEFIKKNGKKDQTKRNVIAFLQESGSYSFLSSDVVRCLNIEHGAAIRDTLDNFPVKIASHKETMNSHATRLACIVQGLHDAIQSNTFPASHVKVANEALYALTSALVQYERIQDHG